MSVLSFINNSFTLFTLILFHAEFMCFETLKNGLKNRKIDCTEINLGAKECQVTRNSLNQNILNESRVFSNIFIFMSFLEILRTWEMVLSVISFTRVKEVTTVTEKTGGHLAGPNVFCGQIQVERMCLF